MPRPRRMILAALAVVAVVTIAIVGVWLRGMRPLSQEEILAADRAEFDGEIPIPDGGSYLFHFRLPHDRSLEIQVVHRRPDFGGNPEFQEIRLYKFAGPDRYIDLKPGSALETKILALLRAAVISPRTADGLPTAGTAERLRWLTDRITDRKTKWGPTNGLSR